MEKEDLHQSQNTASLTTTAESNMYKPDENKEKSISTHFWKTYQQDFRAFKLFNTRRKNKMVENFKRLNPT